MEWRVSPHPQRNLNQPHTSSTLTSLQCATYISSYHYILLVCICISCILVFLIYLLLINFWLKNPSQWKFRKFYTEGKYWISFRLICNFRNFVSTSPIIHRNPQKSAKTQNPTKIPQTPKKPTLPRKNLPWVFLGEPRRTPGFSEPCAYISSNWSLIHIWKHTRTWPSRAFVWRADKFSRADEIWCCICRCHSHQPFRLRDNIGGWCSKFLWYVSKLD